MNCSQCQFSFDQSTHVPRLLIFCGHSLCQKCCRQLHSNNRIQCPECFSNTFIQQVNFLPKNLALLKVNSNTNNHGYCIKHQKKYQAFCQRQKILICVDCILHDNHRNHQMDSIKNSHNVQEQQLNQSIKTLQQILTKLQAKYEENLTNQKEYYENYQNNYQATFQFYQQLKDLIEKQQQQHFVKMRQQYDNNVVKFQQKNIKFANKIEEILGVLNGLKEAKEMNQIQFLASVNARQQMLGNVNNNNVEDSFKVVNTLQSKNNIADLMIKSIQKNYKILNNISVAPINQIASKTPQVSGRVKKTSNIGQVQSVKSYDYNQQPPFGQNLKPMAKKNIKKDSITASPVFNSVTANVISTKSNTVLPLTKSCMNVEPDKKHQMQNKSKIQQKQKQKYDIAKNCDISIVQQKQSLFNSFFSNMTSFLTQQKQIYVIGGLDSQSRNIVKFNLNTCKWEQVTSLKTPRSKFGCVVVDKNIYVIGGKKGKERVSDIQVWSNGKWKQNNFALKKKRSGFGVIPYENFVYVIGGNDGQNILNTVQILNTETGQWIKAQPMTQARDQFSVCLGKNNKIYAIGGFGKNNQPLKSVQAFDIVSQKWSKAPPLNIPRRALAAASLADGIYAIGGFDGTKHLSSVQKYEQGSNQWIKVTDLNKGRCTHAAVSIFDTQQIIVMGGFDQQALDSVQKYSLITNQWQQIAIMPTPRFMHSCVLYSQ